MSERGRRHETLAAKQPQAPPARSERNTTMRAAALVLVLGLAGCTFAQRHPAVAAAIAGGSIGFGGCEISDSHLAVSTCGLVGAAGAVFLGGVVAIVTLFVDPADHELPPEEPLEEPLAPIVRHPHVQPPPSAIDAGVVDSMLDPPHD